ncbi:unnamed protein product [Schistocephalus solidus]|uniref:C2H2-type domain-containing protein n=1 Tax=Schistocephalus solidus TaxID=70667 RepID=A0A183SF17_SCHSO|nr:unnamed protein product [Schistocephalus solidus]
MHQQSDNSNFYVKFCQPSFRRPTLTLGVNAIPLTIIEITSLYKSPVTPTTAAVINIASDGESLLNCPQCDRTFTLSIGLVGNLRIHRTGTGESGPGAPMHTRDRHLHCPHRPRASTHRMRIRGSGIHPMPKTLTPHEHPPLLPFLPPLPSH